MGIELGRISGPLLSANLLRHGADLAFETDLLYIDVVSPNGRIGVNTSTPNSTLNVAGTTRTTNLITDTQIDIGDLTFVNYRIQNSAGGAINIVPDQSIDPTVVVNELQTANLSITNRSITNFTLDSNINLAADGTGNVRFNTTQVNVYGDLHSTGDITLDGNITIGSGSDDSVTFRADVNSDLVPDVGLTYDLGTSSKQWNTLYSDNITTDILNSPTSVVNGIDLLLSASNSIYVSVNGSDSNLGTHLQSTFRTIKHALSFAQPGDEVIIFPGTYEEDFPLTVPQGVSVRGGSTRDVTIVPTPATDHNDAFLLNGETTVSYLSVQNYYFDSVNNTGYGFKFAPNMKVTSRSPYVFNVTCITKGSVTTPSDPRGFNAGDAGGGAYIDGSVASVDTALEPTCLFFSVTFITPNQDGITATNGVRIEWLNSFTYFNKRGIYLTPGTLGRSSLGVKFGAEFRSINSANVYGTYGAVADGPDTLGYLIGHNFGYIGTGGNSQNDYGLVVQANEVVAVDGGELYYDSMDHKGDYRVGDVFYVNQQTGQVTFNAQAINFSASGSIVLEGPTGSVIIDASQVQVSNIRIHDNNIDSLVGPTNILAYSGKTYLNTDVFVTGNFDVTGDVLVGGNVTVGNNPLDVVRVYPRVAQDLKPDLDNQYTLGKKSVTPKVWDVLYVNAVDVDSVTSFLNNTISTLTTDTDLKFYAAGTGKVIVSNTDVQIDNNLTVGTNLTVNGITNLQDTETIGTITLGGNIDQTGDTYIIGLFGNNNISITGPTSYLETPEIRIVNNQIQIIAPDTNLEFVANGTGGVILDRRLKITDTTISNVWASATTNLQKSIEFTPNGTGNLVIDSTSFLTLPYANNTTRVLSTFGEVRQNSTTGWYEGYLPSGPVSFNNLYDVDKNTYITAELTPGASDDILRYGINGTVRATLDTSKLFSSRMEVDSFVITGNTIQNTVTNEDIIINPISGSVGLNGILFNNTTITNTDANALTIVSTGKGYVKFTGTKGFVIPFGNTSERNSNAETGQTRYNNELVRLEVFNGIEWIPAVGTLGAAPAYEVDEILDLMSLIFG